MSTNLMIIDFSVITFMIEHELEKINLRENYQSLRELNPVTFDKPIKKIVEHFVRNKWAYKINRGSEYLPFSNFIPVVVADTKPYWRSKYFPDYKGGRKPKTELHKTVKTIGIETVKQLGYHLFEAPGYEADDLAGAIVRTNALAKIVDPESAIAKPNIFLWTVDSDWMQLISPSVVWVNTGPWEPKVRTMRNYNVWCKKRLKTELSQPQDIVAIKSIQGDKSDNLPPGTPPYFIDLLNTHPDHNILNSQIHRDYIFNIPNMPKNSKETLMKAKQELAYYPL